MTGINMAKVEELPTELISNIAARLHADDIAALRLTNRAIEKKTFHEFATAFGEKAFMFTTESLKVLVDIANSEKMCGYLQNVHFVTAVFSDNAFNCPNGCNCTWQPSIREQEAYRTYMNDQKMLAKTGRDKEMLVEAFTKLTHLKSLSIDDSPGALSPDVDYRGSHKVPRLAGRGPALPIDPTKDKEYSAFLEHTWKITAEALAESKVRTLTSFYTQLSRSTNGLTISPGLAFNKQTLPSLAEVFHSVKTVLLRLRTPIERSMSDKTMADRRLRDAKLIMKLGKTLPALEVLSLSFDNGASSGISFLALTGALDTSKLTDLYLDGLFITATQLASTISKLAAIKDLRLTFINISKGTWITVLKTLQKLADSLHHLHLMYLLEGGRKACFLKQIARDDLAGDLYGDDFPDGSSDDEDDEGDDDSDEGSNGDMPPLEPGDAVVTSATSLQTASVENEEALVTHDTSATTDGLPSLVPQALNTASVIVPTQPATHPFFNPGPAPVNPLPAGHSTVNHVSLDDPSTTERGYYVCVKDEEIAAQLPTFIEQYNVGEDVGADDLALPPGMAGILPAGPPGSFNQFMGMMGALFGPPPPGMPTMPPMPPGAGTAGPGVGVGGPGGQAGGPNVNPPASATAAANGGTFQFLGPFPVPGGIGAQYTATLNTNGGHGGKGDATDDIWDGNSDEWEDDGEDDAEDGAEE